MTPAKARDDVAEAYVDLRAAALLDRVPNAVERQRGGGRRPGGVRPLPAGPRRRHDGRVAEGLSVGRRHAPRDRPPQVGPSPARDVCRRVAAGTARDRRGRRRPGRARRAGRLAVDVVPPPARAADPGRARGLPAPRRVRLRLRGGRPDRRGRRRRRAASTRSGRASSSPRTGPGSTPRRRSATSSSADSSPPRRAATSTA